KQHWLGSAGSDPSARNAMPLTERATIALLEDLQRRWADASPVVAGGEPVAVSGAAAPGAASSARLRFGLPRIHAADLQPKADGRAAEGGVDPRYEYGRWEQNTIIRLALGADGERRQPAALVMAEGETVDRVERRPGGRVVFERHGAAPRAALGAP